MGSGSQGAENSKDTENSSLISFQNAYKISEELTYFDTDTLNRLSNRLKLIPPQPHCPSIQPAVLEKERTSEC